MDIAKLPFSVNDILYGGVAPVVVACLVSVCLRRALPSDLAERYAASVAVLAGFLTGYGLLSLAPWTPATHWHWLPYAMIGAAVVGPVAVASGVRTVDRVLLYVVVATAAAWMLVPTWELTPSRNVHLLVVAAAIVVLASVLEPLAKRLPGPILPAVLWGSMTAAAIVLAMSGSLRFSLMAGAGAAALFGCMLAACFLRGTNVTTGAGLLYGTMVVGSLLIGYVNSYSEIPLVSYALIPLAPVTLWCATLRPIKKLNGKMQTLVMLGLAAVPLLVALAMAAVVELRGSAS